jgi:hypothetical protein
MSSFGKILPVIILALISCSSSYKDAFISKKKSKTSESMEDFFDRKFGKDDEQLTKKDESIFGNKSIDSLWQQRNSFSPRNIDYKIAILAPKINSENSIGADILNAAKIAMFDVGADNISLIPVECNENSNMSQISDTISTLSPNIIIGPVFSQQTKELKEKLKNKTSIISLSNDVSIADKDVDIFGINSSEKVTKAIQIAKNLNRKNLGVLFANNAQGFRNFNVMSNYTKNKKNDINIMSWDFYDNDESKMSTSIYKISQKFSINYKVNQYGELFLMNVKDIKKYKNQDFKEKTVYMDAIITDLGGSDIVKALSIMDQYGLTKKDIVIISINTPKQEFYDILSNYTIDMYFIERNLKKEQMLFNNFMDKYGYVPSRFASLSYDIIGATSILAKNDALTKENLHNPEGFAGTSGEFRIGNDGITYRKYNLYKLNNGRLDLDSAI